MAGKERTPLADPAESSGKKRPRGKPFPKGTSGNPGGRPKSIPEVRAYCLEQAFEVVDRIVARAKTDRDAPLSVLLDTVKELFDRAGVRGANANNQREAKRIETIVAALALETMTDENRRVLIDQLAKAPAEE